MSKTKHTPGPFAAFVKHGVICVHLAKDDPAHLTEVIAWPGFDSCDIGSQDERVANAHLFAAAPELLDALTAAMDYIEKSPCDPDIHMDQWAAWQLLQSTNPKAVIAKARGEVT